jgi:hypothetical protein
MNHHYFISNTLTYMVSLSRGKADASNSACLQGNHLFNCSIYFLPNFCNKSLATIWSYGSQVTTCKGGPENTSKAIPEAYTHGSNLSQQSVEGAL